MAIKKVLLSKKIGNTIYEIFPKTSADVVVYGESTVAATLAQFAQDLANVYVKDDVDSAISASADALYNRIMGITEEDGATVKEAYDTLKEVAAWIDEHGEVATAFRTDITSLQTALGVAPAEGVEGSGLLKAMADAQAAIEVNAGNIADNADDIAALQTAVSNLETAVGNAESGLVKAMAEAQAAIDALEDDVEDHETRIGGLETVVGDANSGLVKAVADLQSIEPTKVEVSEVNGNIKVDGEEVVVYTHPETHSAEMITETTDRNFVTAAEKAAIASAAEIVVVSSTDEITDETNLYLVEI